MNLHDWIDELCDALDVDLEVDEGLVLDLMTIVAENVGATAAPVSAYILGYAAGVTEAAPERVERLAAHAQALAEEWDRPHGVVDPDDEAEIEEPEIDESVDGLDELDELDEEYADR